MKKFKVGVQLYSIRDEMQKDADSALKAVKEMGYDYVELGGYLGRTAAELRAMLDKHGLECVSVHQVHDGFVKNEAESIEFLKVLGAKYCAVPWMDVDRHKGSASFGKTVEEFNQVGKALKNAGITFLYHNHDFEFGKFEDKFLIDWLFESISPEILQTEFDTCWVRYAGQDPAAYLKKYSGRCPVVHLKDFVCDNAKGGAAYALIDNDGNEIKGKSREETGFKFKPLGQGIQDFAAILNACEDAGTEYVIVEIDDAPEMPSLDYIRISREYLKSFGL